MKKSCKLTALILVSVLGAGLQGAEYRPEVPETPVPKKMTTRDAVNSLRAEIGTTSPENPEGYLIKLLTSRLSEVPTKDYFKVQKERLIKVNKERLVNARGKMVNIELYNALERNLSRAAAPQPVANPVTAKDGVQASSGKGFWRPYFRDPAKRFMSYIGGMFRRLRNMFGGSKDAQSTAKPAPVVGATGTEPMANQRPEVDVSTSAIENARTIADSIGLGPVKPVKLLSADIIETMIERGSKIVSKNVSKEYFKAACERALDSKPEGGWQPGQIMRVVIVEDYCPDDSFCEKYFLFERTKEGGWDFLRGFIEIKVIKGVKSLRLPIELSDNKVYKVKERSFIIFKEKFYTHGLDLVICEYPVSPSERRQFKLEELIFLPKKFSKNSSFCDAILKVDFKRIDVNDWYYLMFLDGLPLLIPVTTEYISNGPHPLITFWTIRGTLLIH